MPNGTKKTASKSTKIKLVDLAEKLGLKVNVLKEKIEEMGFELSKKESSIEKDLAELIESELAPESDEKEEIDTAEIYDEMISRQLEREIIKSQRKKTAGREVKSDKEEKEEVEEQIKKVKGKKIEIPEVISVKELSEKIGMSAAKIIGELMKNGILANLNQQIDFDTASIIAGEYGIKLTKKITGGDIADVMSGNIENLLAEDDKENMKERSPVVSIMGHVDHGKTKLLDFIRESDVVSTESGGITQHIGAYQVEKNGRKITFLDTPGHEAFTAMRARGAKATDIAILVVAADEGVKPQTIEAINHAREAGIPIIVAINKIDKPNSNPDRVKGELAEHGLQAEDWGGETIMVPVSAMTGEGIPHLLDMILLVAEMQHLQANFDRPAVGTVIEAHMEAGLGAVATIIINAGKLNIGDNIMVGRAYGRVKTMIDHKGKRLKKVSVSDPVRISGLSSVPFSGDILQVCQNEKEAKDKALKIATLVQASEWQHRGIGMDEIISQIHKGKLKTLKIVLKVDTKGSLEAIHQQLVKIKDDRVAIKIIHSGVGDITEGDVMMASASKGIVIGFHVKESPRVSSLAEKENVDIMKYTIIYNLTDDIKNLLGGLLEPEIYIEEIGEVEIKKIFLSGKKDYIIGCKVQKGVVQSKRDVKIMRGEEEIGTAKIISLKHNENNVDEIKENQECGIKLETSVKPEEGDKLIVTKKEKRMRVLSA